MLKVGFATSSSGSVISASGLCRCHPGAKVTAGALFLFFFFLLQKLIFASHFSLHAACEAAIWKDGPGCTHTGSLLWSQYFIVSRSRDIYVSSELFFEKKKKLHETLNRSISLFSSPFSPQQQQQKQKTDLITAYH